MAASESATAAGGDAVRLRIDARGVAHLTLNRPRKHNALSIALIRELRETVAALSVGSDIRVVVLSGEGPSFCAGADLEWIESLLGATRDRRLAESGELAMLLGAIDTLPKPVIARVNGDAYGGGLGLIACCDVAVAAATTGFAFTEVTLGLIPANIAPYIVRRIGHAHARRLMLSGRRFDAGHAQRSGLLDEVVAAEDLDRAVEAEVRQFLRCAPRAVASTKRLIAELADDPAAARAGRTAAALADAFETAEAADGIAWFLKKRTPRWRETDA